MIKNLLSIFMICATFSAQAFVVSGEDRFKEKLSDLESSFKHALAKGDFFELEPVEQARRLLRNGVRTAAFQVEGLGRIYWEYPKRSVSRYAKETNESTKELEGLIGAFDLNVSLRDNKGVEQAAQKLMDYVFEKQWLDDEGNTPYIEELRHGLKDLNWLDDDKERRYLLDQIQDQLKDVRDTKYSMKKLETGMHKLRRELRWVSMYAIALNGTIQKSAYDKSCQMNFRVVDGKYAKLPPARPGEEVCVVNQCLYDNLVGAIDTFGRLKDQAEPLVKADKKLKRKDRLPEELVPQAEELYERLHKSKILGDLAKQFKDCR